MFDNYGQPCMQPLIMYSVRSLAGVVISGSSKRAQVQHFRTFELIPLHDPSPPLEQADFPNEFKPHSTITLRRRRLASSIGELCATMEEPEPLIVSGCGVPTPTKAWIKLSFRPSPTFQGGEDRRCWDCSVNSYIQVKTFYSTAPLIGMPNDHLRRASRHLHVRLESIVLASRKTSLCIHDLIDGPLQQDKRLVDPSSPFQGLLLPIDVAQTLLPTFCSLLAARRYVLRVIIQIKGLHHPPLVLDTPLQICHSSSPGIHVDHGFLGHDDQICSPASPKPFHTSTYDEEGLREVSLRFIAGSYIMYGMLID